MEDYARHYKPSRMGVYSSLRDWHGTVTPTHPDYTFEPPFVEIDNDSIAIDGQIVVNFTAIPMVSIDNLELPESFVVEQNYPNPFNPSTTIRFGLSEAGPVSIVIYDVQGSQVIDLVNHHHSAGWYETNWNGVNSFGYPVGTGVYFARITSGNF